MQNENPTNEDKNKAEEPISKGLIAIEKIIVGLFVFFGNFARTFYTSIFKPSYLFKKLEKNNYDTNLVLPYTYLAFAAILGGIGMKHKDLRQALYGNSLLKAIQEYALITEPQDIVLRALPILFTIILAILLLNVLLRKKGEYLKSATGQIIVLAAGTQLVIIFVRALVITIYAWFKKAELIKDDIWVIESEITLISIIYIIITSSIIIAIIPLIYNFVKGIKRKTSNKLIIAKRIFQSSIISIFFYWVINIGVISPNLITKAINFDVTHIGNKYREIVYADILNGTLNLKSGKIKILFLIHNNSNEEVVLYPMDPDIWILTFDHLVEYIPKLDVYVTLNTNTTSWQGNEKLVKIKKSETFWIEVEADADTVLTNKVKKFKQDYKNHFNIEYTENSIYFKYELTFKPGRQEMDGDGIIDIIN